MAEGKQPTKRKTITLAMETLEYLKRLASKGTHGSDVAGVARTLVEDGVRTAIKDGFLRVRDDPPES